MTHHSKYLAHYGNKFYDQYGVTKLLLAVIHVTTYDQADANIRVAMENGANGTFLINHAIPPSDLLLIYDRLRQEWPPEKYFMGLNLLGLSTPQALAQVPLTASALWVDDGGLQEDDRTHREYAAHRMRRHDWSGVYLGSVAFKYCPSALPAPDAAFYAQDHMDVVVTSGQETGQPPDVDKIAAMRRVMRPTRPLAIASGIAADNISDFLPHAQVFLVATKISKTFTELDPYLTRELASRIHQ